MTVCIDGLVSENLRCDRYRGTTRRAFVELTIRFELMIRVHFNRGILMEGMKSINQSGNCRFRERRIESLIGGMGSAIGLKYRRIGHGRQATLEVGG